MLLIRSSVAELPVGDAGIWSCPICCCGKLTTLARSRATQHFLISEFCEPKLLQHTKTKITQELEIFIWNHNVCVFNTMLRSFETCFEMGALRNTQRMRGVVGKSCREGEWSPTEEDLIGSSVAGLFDTQLVFFVGKIKIAHGQETAFRWMANEKKLRSVYGQGSAKMYVNHVK